MGRRKNPVGETIISSMIAGAAAGMAGAYTGVKMAERKKRLNPGKGKEKEVFSISIGMRNMENGEVKKYEYGVSSKKLASQKVMEFVRNTGRLWEVSVIVDGSEEGNVFEGAFSGDTGKWTVFSEGRLGVKNLGPRKNPGSQSAERMSEKFHGRPVSDWLELSESFEDDTELAVLGILTEIELRGRNGVVPVEFGRAGRVKVDPKKDVLVCANGEGTQLYLVGGDQDLSDVMGELKKQGVDVQDRVKKSSLGEIYSISYYTDKHHLSGPDQSKGCEYIHKLGEESGIKPVLVWDKVRNEMEIVGGDYEVKNVGIWN